MRGYEGDCPDEIAHGILLPYSENGEVSGNERVFSVTTWKVHEMVSKTHLMLVRKYIRGRCNSDMKRRTLVVSIFAASGSSVGGCLDNGDSMHDPGESRGNDVPTDEETDVSSGTGTDPEGGQEATGSDVRERPRTSQGSLAKDFKSTFEVLSVDTGDVDESASVTFDENTIVVTGEILGSNTCYTARLDSTTIEDKALHVGIVSYEDADEGEGCRDAIVGIEYEASIEISGDSPSSIRVEHNGEPITTEQST
jgi:hypothetical protein